MNKSSDLAIGNFVGPLCFKKEDAPRYVPGFIVVVVTSIIAALLALVYRVMCMWTNKRRDKAGIMEGFDHAYEDDLTDKKVCVIAPELEQLLIMSQNEQFRYIL